jgi:hypothetical protein
MGLRLLLADSAAEQDAAREVEARVFLEAFGNTPDTMDQEYGRYADRSRFVTVLDGETGRAVGAARIIVPDDAGELKTLTDVAGGPWRLCVPDSLRAAGLSGRAVWDAATLAVDPAYRRGRAGTEVVLALIHGLFRYTHDSGVPGAVTILDDHVLRLARDMGVPWTPMAGATSQPYLGSPASTPCTLSLDAYPAAVRERRPDLAPALVDGRFRSIAADPAELAPGRGADAWDLTGCGTGSVLQAAGQLPT